MGNGLLKSKINTFNVMKFIIKTKMTNKLISYQLKVILISKFNKFIDFT